MTPQDLAIYLAALSPRDMMKNLDFVAGMARRIRLRQGVGSQDDELALCRVMLDLKFVTELVEALKDELTNAASLRETYERMLAEKNEQIKFLKDPDGRDIQPPETGTRHQDK